MNRTILLAQILGALIFSVAATAIADSAGIDPGQQQARRQKMMGNPKIGEATAVIRLEAIRIPGKIEYPNLTARSGRQSIQVDLDWTANLASFLRLATDGVPLGGRKILLRVGGKQFELKNPVITAIAWPEAAEAQFNPKEIGIDKCVGLKMDTDVAEYREGGVNDTTHKRSFQGVFKGEIVGIEPAVFQKVHAFEVPILHGSRGAQNNKGSMKVEMSEAAARAAQWTADRRKANPYAIFSQRVRLALLDTAQRPLLQASMRVRDVKPIGFTSAEGRSMSFELFFDTFEVGEPGDVRRGG